MRMCGYYISFEETGVQEIDAILSAVACAAKAYHHTESWNDECSKSYEPEYFEGTTPVAWIQDAANRAARAWQEALRLQHQLAQVTAERDEYKAGMANYRTRLANAKTELQTAKAEGVRVRELLSKDPLFKKFLDQGFWHAHHVDIVWRYNGEDERYEADWIKELWYHCKQHLTNAGQKD